MGSGIIIKKPTKQLWVDQPTNLQPIHALRYNPTRCFSLVLFNLLK